jgi:predicted transposase YbfD/YdcC
MIERWIKRNGKDTYEKVFGLTSLSKERADSKQVFSILRSHWSIENRSHWVRDVTYDEDRSQVRDSEIAQFMALFRNIAIGLIRLDGFVNISKANKLFASNPLLALPLLTLKIK